MPPIRFQRNDLDGGFARQEWTATQDAKQQRRLSTRPGRQSFRHRQRNPNRRFQALASNPLIRQEVANQRDQNDR